MNSTVAPGQISPAGRATVGATADTNSLWMSCCYLCATWCS